MKIGGAIVLAAIIGSIITVVGFWAIGRYDKWEKMRDEQWNALASLDRQVNSVSERTKYENSIEALTANIHELSELSKSIREVEENLIWTLRNKPLFLPLTGDESKLLSSLTKKPEASPTPAPVDASNGDSSPSPSPLDASNANSHRNGQISYSSPCEHPVVAPDGRKGIRITGEVILKLNRGNWRVPIGTRLSLKSEDSSDYLVDYGGVPVKIPLYSARKCED